MSAPEVKWQDPPEVRMNRRGQSKYAAVAETLRSRPHEWALILEDSSPALITPWRKGTAYFPKGEFEFRTVGVAGSPTRRADIYARYIGEVTP